METSCQRCHRTLEADISYCPGCGLPQLVYATEADVDAGHPESWIGADRDASSVEWKSALKAALLLAVPSGLLCSLLSPFGILVMPLMAATSVWVVALYLRGQRPAWITLGAGARIGLVTGIVGGWVAAVTTGAALYALRFAFHQGAAIDEFWQNRVVQGAVDQWTTMGVDVQTITAMKAWLLSAEGRAGWALGALTCLLGGLLLSAAGGGALGARLMVHSRRPQD